MHRAGQRQLSNTKRLKIAGGLKHSQAPIDVNSTQIRYLFVEQRVYRCWIVWHRKPLPLKGDITQSTERLKYLTHHLPKPIFIESVSSDHADRMSWYNGGTKIEHKKQCKFKTNETVTISTKQLGNMFECN